MGFVEHKIWFLGRNWSSLPTPQTEQAPKASPINHPSNQGTLMSASEHWEVSADRGLQVLRKDCGLTTPLLNMMNTSTTSSSRSSSPCPPGTGDTSQSLGSRVTQADKFKRFQRYLQFMNIGFTAMRGGEVEDVDDSDLFYDYQVRSKRRDVRYVQRPFIWNSKEEIEVDDGAKYAYDRYDVHRRQGLLPFDEAIGASSRYDDSLELRELTPLLVEGFEESVKYKGNLTECFQELLFFGSHSQVLIYRDEKLYKTIQTKPRMTMREHRDHAVWPYFPHTLNTIKCVRLNDIDCLVCCVDDGRVLIFKIADFYNEIIEPMYEITMKSSVWGVDAQGDVLVVSDNTHKVTLFHLVSGEGIQIGQSVELIHNVPDVCVVKCESMNVTVSCCSISGELCVLEFVIDSGGFIAMTRQLKMAEHEDEMSITSKVKYRTQLQEQLWTVSSVNSSDFKEVNNPEYLGSKEVINTLEVLQCSQILGVSENHLVTSHLGRAADFVNVHCMTKYGSSERTNILNSVTDKVSRIKKVYYDMPLGGRTSFDQDEKFLIATTITNVALFSERQLVCRAYTDDLFDFDLMEELEYANRLSIVKVIAELSVVVAVSQAGYLTVFRLVKHRGLFSMREEHVWPRDAETTVNVESIAGVGVRIASWGCVLYVTLSSGRVHRLELREREGYVLL